MTRIRRCSILHVILSVIYASNKQASTKLSELQVRELFDATEFFVFTNKIDRDLRGASWIQVQMEE